MKEEEEERGKIEGKEDLEQKGLTNREKNKERREGTEGKLNSHRQACLFFLKIVTRYPGNI